jgi:hypothetical protein
MKFFEQIRPNVFFRGGKLKQVAKTGKKFWTLKLVVTLDDALINQCDQMLISNYQQICAYENAIEEITLTSEIEDQSVQFFATHDMKAPQLMYLTGCRIFGLVMRREEDVCELEFECEHPLTDQLHAFVKDYAFSTFSAAFTPMQATLPNILKAGKKDTIDDFEDDGPPKPRLN